MSYAERIESGKLKIENEATHKSCHKVLLFIALASFLIFNFQFSIAQEQWLQRLAPGYDSVASDTTEYRRVLDKFSAALVRPTVRDCAIVYYGSTMQPGFTAGIPGEEDMQRAIMAEDHLTAYSLGVQILERTPANLTALYWTLFAATEIGQPWEVRNSLRGRYNSISHIISLSGNGQTPQTAFKVVWPGDMYTYAIMELGLEVGEGYLWDNRWTEFEVTPAGPDTKYSHSSIFFEVVTAAE